jgi:hypothetical protein
LNFGLYTIGSNFLARKNFKPQKVPKRKKVKKITYKEYSQECKFKFDIEKFPNEFDLDLIEKLGWYTANNPSGISRDHMLSISYGWKNNIVPSIIKHPANCKLMVYEENHKKGNGSSIDITELTERINNWNDKYK